MDQDIPLIPFGPDATCTLDLCPVDYSVLGYRPSVAANAIFLCLFSSLMCVHIVLGIRWKSWWFMGCMVVGCFTEITGYVGRILLYINPFSFAGFMMQIVCVGSAPVFYSAAIYVTITKTVENLDPSISRVKPKLYYIIFVLCDLSALVMQGVGGGLSTSSNGEDGIAVDLSLAGLSFQVITMVTFCALLAEYLIRYFKSTPTKASPRLRIFLASLSLAIVLILARCAYRVAELGQGYSGTIFRDEPLYIGLEGVLMVLAVMSLCIGHPGFVFLQSESGLKGSFVDAEDGSIAMVRLRTQ
ncbi:RTA1-domain-containing protein [Xylariomycetidae sp. FL2044]|nr:RTA1-domain-containing protein [Xylariomycetidae sp. FL2044]